MESATGSTSCQSQVPFVLVSSLEMNVSLGHSTSSNRHPSLVDHSTTLIFTPGNYSLRTTFSIANIKSFTMNGDGATLLFRLSLTNIGYVHLHGLTFTNNPLITVRYVHTFVLENCTLSLPPGSSSRVGLNLYRSNQNRISDSRFERTSITERQSHTALSVKGCTFTNVDGISCITGNFIKIHSSRFENNYAPINVVRGQHSVTVIDCLFDRNSRGAVFGSGDITVMNSSFMSNEVMYESRNYRGGSAIVGEQNINIWNCTFSFYTRDPIVYAFPHYAGSYRIYIINSNFLHSKRAINTGILRDVIITNSNFCNITYCGNGGAIYSSKSVTIMNCTFVDITAVNGRGGAVYSLQGITARDSTFINCSAARDRYDNNYEHGGTLYSEQAINVTSCIISGSFAIGNGGTVYSSQNVTITNTNIINSVSLSGSGGAVYGLNVKVTDSNLIIIRALRDGGAIYGRENVITINSTIVSSIASVGNGGAVYCGKNARVVNVIINGSKASIGDGGAIYSGNDVTAIGSTISECLALNGEGGAIYSAASSASLEREPGFKVIGGTSASSKPNIVFTNCTFKYNLATTGGVLYTYGYYSHYIEFTDCAFDFNEATSNVSGGGVAFIGNSTLAIISSKFKNNRAAGNGGVLDFSFTSMSIEQGSFTNNAANENGGVFYGRNYSINITAKHTDFGHNSAENGGVFYIHRGNSNIKVADHSAFIENSASNHGGVMDIRGVTLTMDMDTMITNNTAGSSGNVISACVSQITAYGLEAWLDPLYPLYCSIYDEGSSYTTSQSTTPDISTAPVTPATEHLKTIDYQTGTYAHDKTETEMFVETTTKRVSAATVHSEETTATQQTKSSIATTTSVMTTSGDISGTKTTNAVTASSSSSTTPQMSTDNITTTPDNTPTQHNPLTISPTLIATTDHDRARPRINGVTDDINVIGGHPVTSASFTPTTDSDAPKDNEDFTVINYSGTSKPTKSHHTTEAPLANPTDSADNTESVTSNSDTDDSKKTDSSATTQFMSISTEEISTSDPNDDKKTATTHIIAEVQANEEDKYSVQSSSQQALLQVAVISLAVLCAICFTVCAIMFVLFFIACRKRSSPPQGYYKKVPLTEKDQDVKLNETKELGKE